MGLDSSPVTNPSLKTLPASSRPPISRARSPASATASSGSLPARGRMAAAIIGARLESGPMIRTREGPKTA